MSPSPRSNHSKDEMTSTRCCEDLSWSTAMIRLNKLSEVEELYQPNPTYIGLIQVDGMTEGWRHKITVWFDQVRIID